MAALIFRNTGKTCDMWGGAVRTALVSGASVRIINPEQLITGSDIWVEVSGSNEVMESVKGELRASQIPFYQQG